MKFLAAIIALVFVFCQASHAQALGTWQYYLPANTVNSIAIDNQGTVFCGTLDSYLFSYNPQDYSIEKYFKNQGVSQPEVQKIAWNEQYQMLVIAYQNADINLWWNNENLYIPEIRLATVQGNKTIQGISFYQNYIYFSCAFGVVVYDIEKKEVKDTYFLGENSSILSIQQTVVFQNKIYAATQQGLLVASLDNPNLANYTNWQNINPQAENNSICRHIAAANNQIYAVFDKNLYAFDGNEWQPLYQETDSYILNYVLPQQNELILLALKVDSLGNDQYNAKVVYLDNNGNQTQILTNEKIRKPQEIKSDKQGNIWLADQWNGLLRIENKTAKEWIKPNGPGSKDVYNLVFDNDKLWVAAGGVGRNGNTYLGREAGIYQYQNGTWKNHNQYTDGLLVDVIDILDIVPNPELGKTWISSYRNGLLEYQDGAFIYKYDQTNSIIQPAIGDDGSSRVRGMALDQDNNLWMCNHASPTPLLVKNPQGVWQALGANLPSFDLVDVTIDQQNIKWLSTNSAGLIAYHSGDDPLNPNDDEYLQYTAANSELETNRITATALDKDGQLWIASREGVYVIYCPYATFTNGCPPSRPTIEDPQTGKLGYVLWYDFVRCIAIDAANRKWFGTTNGLWVFDEDVQNVEHHFTTQNSPLPDNDIKTLAINHQTGEAFIGTAKGLVSYQNQAIQGSQIQDESPVLIYPNPVRPNYEGDIAIKGLVENAQVKITDTSGTLVFATQALGGQAVWNGYLLNGQRAASGVYLVYSTNEAGQEKFAGKFVIIN